jgi:2-oxoglutarate ferredoxin oxidoreductase subunit beta
MTGGQYSPTTPFGAHSTTSIYGHIEHAFSIAELAVTAGASFVSRATVYHAQLLDQLIEQAMAKPGFAVVEVISNCHVQYGRRNQMGGAVEMLRSFKDNSVTVQQAAKLSPEELESKTTIGVLTDRELPISTDEYDKIRRMAGEECEHP